MLNTYTPIELIHRETQRQAAKESVRETEGGAEIGIVPICAYRHLIFVPVRESTFSVSDTDVHSVC